MRQRIEDATRRAQGYLSRRQFVGASAFAIGMAADVVTDPFFEPVRMAWSDVVHPPAPERDPWHAADFPLTLIPAHGHRRQAAVYAAWKAGIDIISRLSDLDPDGVHAVISFVDTQARYAEVGRGLTVIDAAMTPGRPVVSSPDGHYGRFVYARAADCFIRQAPTSATCYGRTPTGAEIEYLSVMLPFGSHVVSVGYPKREWPPAARPASARPGAATRPLENVATT